MTIETVGNACCGCGACAQACPKHCIVMRPDKEGFFVPAIDHALCVDCAVCVKTCPQVEPPEGHLPLQTLAAYGKAEDTRAESSSGGLFTLAAEQVLARGGVVCAVTMAEDTHRAAFSFAETPEELARMRGSKYVQADAGDCYARVRTHLTEGRPVLFAGCPCQVAALHKVLGKEYDGLFTIDIVCHGVPSPLLFQTAYAALEKREGAPVTDYRFRTKKHGWGMFFTYRVRGKERIRHSNFDPYNANFLHCNTYRESCYQCRYAKPSRVGDWTIGDYWGILKEHPQFYSELGVSALLINTPKGEAMREALGDRMAAFDSELDRVARHNINLKAPSTRPAIRNHIYDGLGEMSAEAFVSTRLKVRPGAKETIKALIPYQLKRLYQRRRNRP